MAKYEPKYDVNMSELYKMRVTAEQKRKLFDAASIAAGTASEFWRDYDVYTAEQLVELQAGKITAAEFGSNIANFVTNYMSATLPEHKPDDK